ncbi:hypothetical protein J437_LFUL008094 [Ladona fulva]|uniref:TIR domain-containing protein n=1 Tax=Ladona fulva TaxID=123851 RepID=A0A8K0KAW0_LADFU|nr:hypothetical protein J437_LFUL008094 [Ladona fulva]
MTSGASFCGLIFVILCAKPYLISLGVNGAVFCPVESGCTCSKGSDGTYEMECYRNLVAEESIYDYNFGGRSQVLLIKIKPGFYATVQCHPATEWSDLRLLSGLKVQSCPSITFNYCPLPDSSKNISSFRAFFDFVGVEKVEIISFQSYKTLGDGLKAEHLIGLSGVTKLSLTSNGLTSLPKNSFSGVPDVRWLDLRDNKIQLQSSLFRNLYSLSSIELGSNEISRLPLELFHGLKNLSQLNLWGNKLGLANLSRTHFKDLTMLESLDLSSNILASLDEDIFYDLVSLKTLNLNANSFSSLPTNLFINNKNLQTLRLSNNNAHLPSLPNGLLSNLSLLTSVSLDKSGIENLPGDLFRGSERIKTLSLQGNRLKALPGDIFSDIKSLEKLNLKENQIFDLSQLPFKKLSSLSSLILSFNNLSHLPPALFHDLRSLEELDMRSNKLKTLDLNAFSRNIRLREAYFSNNELSFAESPDEDYDIISFGADSPFGSCTELEILDLANNAIKDIFSDWKIAMLKLKELNLSRNSLSRVSVNDLHFLSSELIVDLRSNNISVIDFEQAVNLSLVQPNADKKSVKIFVDDNPIKCDCNIYHLLKYLEGRVPLQVRSLVDLQVNDLQCLYPSELAGKKLTDLNSKTLICDLGLLELSLEDDEIHFKDLSSDNRTDLVAFVNEKCPATCKCLWRPEDDGLIVDCREGNLSHFPYALPVTRRTSHIELLASGLGLIKLWPASSLNLGYNKISTLELSRNALSSIDASSLPPHLKVLDLHQNNLTHLNKSVKFLPNVTCKSGHASGMPLSQMTLNDLCPISNVIATACISIAVLGLVMGTLAALYYRHQDEIKIWLYAHHLCLWFVTEDELDKDKEYDAFISYSHQDESFVVEELVPVLEGGRFPDKGHPGDVRYIEKKDVIKYKLCLHYRDWIAGQWIPAQIARSVDLSRRTIVVLSPSFLESVWGQMEFRAAHCRSLSEGRSRVIVILYGDVPPADQLDPELRTYLTTNTYVKWGDPWFWRKLRYALPHVQTRKRKKVSASLTLRTNLNEKHWEAVNGQSKPLELIHTNSAAEKETKKC